MQFVPDQAMGYDRAITVFSPDGRLLQVEYAKKAVSLGATALGIVCKDSVLLMADRYRTDKLLIQDSVKKIFKIDDHIIAGSSGFISDARVLVKKCRVRAQQHKMTYGEDMDTESLVKYVADMHQAYTQFGGARPFGISLLIAGIKDEPELFLTEPSGIYFKYKAKAVGMGADEANKMLEKGYKEGMSCDEAMELAVSIFKKVLAKDFHFNRLEVSLVDKSGIKSPNPAQAK